MEEMAGVVFYTNIRKVKGRVIISVRIIQVLKDDSTRPLTPSIDLAYMENGKTFARKPEELWKNAPPMRCLRCGGEHPMPVSLVNALTLLGEGAIKMVRALHSDVDHISLS